jgi:hypothetical protein
MENTEKYVESQVVGIKHRCITLPTKVSEEFLGNMRVEIISEHGDRFINRVRITKPNNQKRVWLFKEDDDLFPRGTKVKVYLI